MQLAVAPQKTASRPPAALPETRVRAREISAGTRIWSEPSLTTIPRQVYVESCTTRASGYARYTQSDPIGLGGGINLYGYSLANPVRYADRLGLTTWKCNIGLAGLSLPIGFGAIGLTIDCTSQECTAGNKQLNVILAGSAVGLSAGLPIDISAFTAVVEDSDTSPRASSLEGKVAYSSAGVSVGVGLSFSQIVIGSAKSKPGFGGQVGVGGGIEAFGGAVAIVKEKSQPCCGPTK